MSRQRQVQCSPETYASLQRVALNENSTVEKIAKSLLGLNGKAEITVIANCSDENFVPTKTESEGTEERSLPIPILVPKKG